MRTGRIIPFEINQLYAPEHFESKLLRSIGIYTIGQVLNLNYGPRTSAPNPACQTGHR
mgnify:CR=1 FL=1